MSKKIIFRKNINIGAPDAEQDEEFLAKCFVNTGDFTALRDPLDNKRIILGRTGSGKTALINHLVRSEEHVIEVPPESLSFAYLSNSTVLQFFSEIGLDLDIFYRLLWRHVFAVELIKRKYNLVNEHAQKSFFESIRNIFDRDKTKREAINYLNQWGDSFWLETEYRIKEVTTKLEEELKGAAKAGGKGISLGLGAAQSLSEEQKAEVLHRGQSVVDEVQIKQLSRVMDLLAEDIFDDAKERYYIAIDKLDENWADDRLRYKMIRALVETIKDFKKVKHVKIIVAIRLDLLERVFRYTRSPGFQEEKYESLFLYLSWDRKMLVDVLHERINYLMKSQYTGQSLSFDDIFHSTKILKEKPIDFITKRSMMRPRDVIVFFNTCLRYAEGKSVINKSILVAAEGEYSKSRLRALQDEWFSDYPDLIDFVVVLKKTSRSFLLREFDDDLLETYSMEIAAKAIPNEQNGIVGLFNKVCLNGGGDIQYFKKILFHIFHKVGLVGIKPDTFTEVSWSYEKLRVNLSSSEITEDSRAYIHPFVWRVLGTAVR